VRHLEKVHWGTCSAGEENVAHARRLLAVLVLLTFPIYGISGAQETPPAPGSSIRAAPMPGQQVDADQEALVRELMEISGVKASCEQVPLFAPGWAKLAEGATDMPYETLHKVFSVVLRPELFYRGVENYLNKNFNRAYCLQALEWFRSPLGRKITQAELEADLPDSQPRVESYAKQLQRTPPTQRRMELIERLAEASGKIEFSAELIGGFVERVLSPRRQFTAEGLERLRKGFRAFAMAAGNPSLTYPYRALTSDELTKYIEFLESDAGKWDLKTTQEGFKEVWLARTEEAGKQLAKAGAGKGRVTKPE
jgi:hypothetical protein